MLPGWHVTNGLGDVVLPGAKACTFVHLHAKLCGLQCHFPESPLSRRLICRCHYRLPSDCHALPHVMGWLKGCNDYSGPAVQPPALTLPTPSPHARDICMTLTPAATCVLSKRRKKIDGPAGCLACKALLLHWRGGLPRTAEPRGEDTPATASTAAAAARTHTPHDGTA